MRKFVPPLAALLVTGAIVSAATLGGHHDRPGRIGRDRGHLL